MGAISTRAIARHGRRETTEAERTFEELVGWMASKPALSLPLHEVERVEEAQIREVARLLLQEHINARGQGAVGHAHKGRFFYQAAIGAGVSHTLLPFR